MGERSGAKGRWLERADLRVIGLRVLLLAIVAPLLAVGYDVLADQRWADHLTTRLFGMGLLSPPPWFWRLALFMAVLIIVPVSLVERLALRWEPLTRRRVLVASLLAGAVTVPCALVALAQTQYAPDALAGDPEEGSAAAMTAVRGILAQPSRVFLGSALAFVAPFVVLTWLRLRDVRLRTTWPATLVLSAGVAALAMHLVAGLQLVGWLAWRTDFWTAVSTAFLLPPVFALVDRLDAWWVGSVPSGGDGVD